MKTSGPDGPLLRHEFVEYLPEILDEGVLYVSIPFATASHKCCCGCGGEVVTPLSPTDWQMIFDGKSVSLTPSIGNWSFRCQSHYWIRRNRVAWAPRWTAEEIALGRSIDRRAKDQYFGSGEPPSKRGPSWPSDGADRSAWTLRLLRRLTRWLRL